MIFYRTAHQRRLLQRQESITNSRYRTLGRECVFVEKKPMKPGKVCLRSCRKDDLYRWHAGMGVSGFSCTSSAHVLSWSSVMCKPVSL